LAQAIEAKRTETLIFYTQDHNGDQMYLGVEEQKPFRIFNNLDSAQIQDMLKSPYNQSCTFELLSGVKDCTSMHLGLNWSSPTFEFLQKPGVESNAILYVNFVNGEEDTETHEETQYLWSSVRDLERFDHASKNDGNFIVDSAQTCKSDTIMAFLQDYSKNELVDTGDISVKKRQDYDFTDYFWEFVKGIKGFKRFRYQF
jgi:hypothetical protein